MNANVTNLVLKFSPYPENKVDCRLTRHSGCCKRVLDAKVLKAAEQAGVQIQAD